MNKYFPQRFPTSLILGFSYLILYLPILIFIVFSFNTSHFPSPWEGFTLSWYQKLFHSPLIWTSLLNSFITALLSTISSLTLGICIILFHLKGGSIKKITPLFYGNLVIPETVLAISLLSYFLMLNITLGLMTLIVSHTILGIGILIPILLNRCSQLDKHLQEASLSLGASSTQTFFYIILPTLRPTLYTTGLLIFILSFDDFVFSYFCAGTSFQTLSLYLISTLRTGISPIVNALSSILFIMSIFIAMIVFIKTRNKQPVNTQRYFNN